MDISNSWETFAKVSLLYNNSLNLSNPDVHITGNLKQSCRRNKSIYKEKDNGQETDTTSLRSFYLSSENSHQFMHQL